MSVNNGKITADIFIYGDLVCKQTVIWEDKLYSCGNSKEKLEKLFDVQRAVLIDGDVVVNNFNGRRYCTVVFGHVIAKGDFNECK